MSGMQHSEQTGDQGSEQPHSQVDDSNTHHAHEHPSHGVPPSFANPLGEAPMEDGEPSPTDGAQVDALEVAGSSKAVADSKVEVVFVAHMQPEDQMVDPAAGLPALLEGSEGELVTPTTKVTVLNADKWNEDYKVRVETLQQEIEELNIRLDQITAHKP